MYMLIKIYSPPCLPHPPFLHLLVGLDPSHFRSSVGHEETDAPSFLPMSREENADVYKDCEPLQFACLECKSINTFSADCLREKDAVVVCM